MPCKGSLLLAVTVLACGAPAQSQEDATPRQLPAHTAVLTTLPTERSWSCVESGFQRPVPESVWTPSGEDLLRFEEAISAKLRSTADALPADEYSRQYVPYLADGRRLVFIAGFHRNVVAFRQAEVSDEEWSAFWRSHLYKVCDGGAYVFAALYDAESKQVVRFSFNFPVNELQ